MKGIIMDLAEKPIINAETVKLSSVDEQGLLALVVIAGAILLLMLAVVAFRIIKNLPKKQASEDVMKELADRKNLSEKLQAQLEAADIDQREEIQARIDKNEKAIKILEKKAKTPKTIA